ncbi:MAG: DUF2062 domain-containing protein [Hyphomicrobiales bacterium]
MLFKRRDKETRINRLRVWAWPRRSWKRSCTYVWHRVTRLAGSPHAIAIGFSMGILASFTPYMGLHFLFAAILAAVVGGNLLASAFGTFIGNPVTFPFIWLATYNFGSLILGRETAEQIDITLPHGIWWRLFTEPTLAFEQFWSVVGPFMVPMTVGGIPLGLLVGTIGYFPIRAAVRGFQDRRREKLLAARERPSDATLRS